MNFFDILGRLMGESGFASIGANFSTTGWQQIVMIIISFVLMYLAIKKEYEPLLLLPIAFGMFLANLPLFKAE